MILFVGDKPSAKMKPGAKPFEGAACEKRLMEWINHVAIGRTYIIVNSTDKDFHEVLSSAIIHGMSIVALGNKAAERITDFSVWISFFKLPHPSGRNRQINDSLFIYFKLEECKAYVDAMW